jgi:hypothetical protein
MLVWASFSNVLYVGSLACNNGTIRILLLILRSFLYQCYSACEGQAISKDTRELNYISLWLRTTCTHRRHQKSGATFLLELIIIIIIIIIILLYIPLLGLGRFFSFLILYRVGRTPWTGDQPVARPLPTHRTTQTQNKRTQYRHPCLEWDSNPRSQRSSEWRQFMP